MEKAVETILELGRSLWPIWVILASLVILLISTRERKTKNKK